MNLDDLKSTWKQRETKLADDHFEEVVSRVLARTLWFETTILRRDLIESVVGIVVVLIFGYLFVRHPEWPWVALLGIAIIMLGVIVGLVVMHWMRRRTRRSRHDISLAEYCASEVVRVDQQIWLLRNVTWWYSGPVLLGCCIFTWGLLNSLRELPNGILLGALAISYGFYFFVGWILHRNNQRALRIELQPVRNELADIVESLRDDSSNGGESGGG